MARQGTPNAGLTLIAQRVFEGPDYTLVAYTNTQDSLGPSTVAADLTQPTASNGYAPLLLNGTWSYSNGVATYQHPVGPNTNDDGHPTWFPSGTWSAAVTGVAMISGSTVQHFMDLRDGADSPVQFTAAAGKRLVVDLVNLAGG